jgi:hypothetical protein
MPASRLLLVPQMKAINVGYPTGWQPLPRSGHLEAGNRADRALPMML